MRIAYRTDGVPQWGTGAFNPVPSTTPLATTGGEQKRYLQQWADTPDPMVVAYDVGRDSDRQGSYANADPKTATHVAGLPLAFRPVANATHAMTYWATNENMGPNGPNTHMKIWSDNPLPVPAGNPGRVALPAQKQPPWATTISTAWPRPFLSWPTWGTSRSQ